MKRIVFGFLVILLVSPVVVMAKQRFFRERAAQFGPAGVTPSQVWRVRTLTMEQRLRMSALQVELIREMRDARDDGAGRRERAFAMAEAQRRITAVVTPEQLELARKEPRGPLSVEEIVYYAIVALPDLEAGRRAKLDAIYGSLLGEARKEAADSGGFGRRRGDAGAAPADVQAREKERSAQRQRRQALFEVTEALLTQDQMLAVKRFLPDSLKMVGLREKIVFRLPSLTLEQEARVRAIYAALEDENGADRARLKALNGDRDLPPAADSGSRRSERREVAQRVNAREEKAYEELKTVLTADQLDELAASAPGPPRGIVFTPERIRELDDVTPQQQARLREALFGFNMATREERQEAKELRDQMKGGDPQSMELAGVRDKLRKVGAVLQTEHDRITRSVADTLTGQQLAKLVATASRKTPNQP